MKLLIENIIESVLSTLKNKGVLPKNIDDATFKEEFIKEVLSIIEDRNVSVMPTSPEIVSFIRKNKRLMAFLH